MKKILFFLMINLISIFSFGENLKINFNVPSGEVYYYNQKIKNVANNPFKDGEINLNLPKGTYSFIFLANKYPQIHMNVEISKDTNLNINFSHEHEIVIDGNVKSGNLNIGGATITLKDKNNTNYEFKSDLYGHFKAYLHSGEYTISTSKSKYYLAENKKYNFKKRMPYKVDIDLMPLPAYIKGQAIDEDGYAIKGVKFYLKLKKNIREIKGDRYGYFSAQVPQGIITIMAQKEGYVQNGRVFYMDKDSSILNVTIPLTRIRASISGVITNGIWPMKNAKVILYDIDFNKLKTVRTNENGFYEFYKIPSHKKVFLCVMERNNIIYKTPNFDLLKDIKNYNLIVK